MLSKQFEEAGEALRAAWELEQTAGDPGPEARGWYRAQWGLVEDGLLKQNNRNEL